MFHLPNNLLVSCLFSPSCWWEKWGSERWGKLICPILKNLKRIEWKLGPRFVSSWSLASIFGERSDPIYGFLKNFFLIMYLFIFVCAESSLLYMRAFSSCGAWASHCGGFSCFRAWTLGRSSFGSCGFWASLLHKWNIPRPGIKPLSPMLAGGFLTTELPGKSFRNFSSC